MATTGRLIAPATAPNAATIAGNDGASSPNAIINGPAAAAAAASATPTNLIVGLSLLNPGISSPEMKCITLVKTLSILRKIGSSSFPIASHTPSTALLNKTNAPATLSTIVSEMRLPVPSAFSNSPVISRRLSLPFSRMETIPGMATVPKISAIAAVSCRCGCSSETI